MTPVDMPHDCDGQYQLFFWEMDEFAPVVVMFMLGIWLDKLTVFFLVSLVLAWMFKRLKDSSLPGLLMHMCYWSGLYDLNKRFTNGLNREYVE